MNYHPTWTCYKCGSPYQSIYALRNLCPTCIQTEAIEKQNKLIAENISRSEYINIDPQHQNFDEVVQLTDTEKTRLKQDKMTWIFFLILYFILSYLIIWTATEGGITLFLILGNTYIFCVLYEKYFDWKIKNLNFLN